MSDIKYWIWLQLTLGQGAHFLPLLEDFGSAEALYNSNILEWKLSPSVTSRQIDSLGRASIRDAEIIMRQCAENGWDIVTYDDKRYPMRLKNISNPPAVLYVDGELPDFDSYAVIGVVGTRNASTYAMKAAHIMSEGMARCGALIVSGGALGVDSAAHRGAMAAGAKTYAVLGNGLGSDYLKSNSELRKKIRENGGALITEYQPFFSATKGAFPMRNRLISALSDGILVIEAGVKSGSLITASHAAEQGRDIFAIPASIFDRNFQGTNKLIDDGAYVATSPESVLCHYSEKYKTLNLSDVRTPYELLHESKNNANAPKKENVGFDNIMQDRRERVGREKTAAALEGKEKKVYNALSEDYQGIEKIIEKSAVAPQGVLVALTMLEMKGLAESASGKRYRLK